jgi:hypothetical protein
MGLLVGLLPLAPYVLMAAVFAVMYTIVAMLAGFVITIRIATGRVDPVHGFNALFTWCTNPLTAFMTMRPVSLATIRSAGLSRIPRDRSGKSSLSVLPAAPGAARAEDSPLFYETRQRMAQLLGGMTDIVPPTDQASQQASGRHARQKAPDSAETPSLASSPA